MNAHRDLVAAAPAREHVRALIQAGVGLRAIRRDCGVNIDRLLYGARDRNGNTHDLDVIDVETARVLLAYNPDLDDYDDTALIDAAGTRRRLQALAAMGWPTELLAGAFDQRPARFADLYTAQHVRAWTARAVRELYDWLSVAPPVARTALEKASVARTKRLARAKGWVGPLAWDDIDTDPQLPSQTYDTDDEADLELDLAAIFEQHANGKPARLRGDELRRIVLALIERGEHSHDDIAELVGCSEKTVDRIRATIRPNSQEEAA